MGKHDFFPNGLWEEAIVSNEKKTASSKA